LHVALVVSVGLLLAVAALAAVLSPGEGLA
jgi:hypothetical protein